MTSSSIYCFIYIITNSFNNKVYIGQTWQSLERRFYEHVNQNKCIKLHNAIIKYGKEVFSIRPLIICHSQLIADYWESYFINKHDSINNGYNIREGGSTGKHSRSTKEKLSIAHRGKRTSPKTEFKAGEKHHSAKINEIIAKNIRLLHETGSFTAKELAEKYQLSQQSIYNILKNINWKV